MKNLAESLGLRRKPYRILTLDGGGVRGILSVVWVERLEHYLRGPVHAHVDLIAGTSIGAVMGCAFAMGMDASELRRIWADSAAVAFAKPASLADHGRRWANRVGLAAKYDGAGLEAMLRSIFGDRCMCDLNRPVLAMSYDLQTMQVHVFSSEREDHLQLPVWEVCRASAAAPLFFDAHSMVVDETGAKHPLADGGLTANNPVVLAISEALREQPSRKGIPVEDVVVASFGTGAPPEGQHQVPRTIFGHGSAILQALITGATASDHVTARTMLPSHNYWRFQSAISERLAEMDNVDHIDDLQALAHAYLQDGADHRLAQLARRMRGLPIEPGWLERLTQRETA
ncbi:patatin-like phospholipase family protein [Imhoffiella purpurea]|uniref:PNPLA domain-containing protein n=1 Tax=Imhoffiella purpurea TaxID=1249627 RepID=W9VCN7_9GAMM|nr:patatin-like phospholipase family protein [Imhoffiella purpurea]EXJ14756.1 hypothetical protein D779_2125 [Imhoffiella purpurea]